MRNQSRTNNKKEDIFMSDIRDIFMSGVSEQHRSQRIKKNNEKRLWNGRVTIWVKDKVFSEYIQTKPILTIIQTG